MSCSATCASTRRPASTRSSWTPVGFLLDPTTFAPYLLGALGTYTDITGHDITLGELGIWTDNTGADITLGELAQYLDDSVSLSDVLLGLVPPTQFPFQDFPIASLGLNKAGRDVIQPNSAGGTAPLRLDRNLDRAGHHEPADVLQPSSSSIPRPDVLPVDRRDDRGHPAGGRRLLPRRRRGRLDHHA